MIEYCQRIICIPGEVSSFLVFWYPSSLPSPSPSLCLSTHILHECWLQRDTCTSIDCEPVQDDLTTHK